MKKLILIGALAFAAAVTHAQSSTNILLGASIQWSTNSGATWFQAIPQGDFGGGPELIPVGDIPAPSFYRMSIVDGGIVNDGTYFPWHLFHVTTLRGTTPNSVTNELDTNDFYVFPTPGYGYGSNIIYRGFMSLSNNTPPVAQFVDTNSYPNDTNIPPVP